jgi:tetratricopeptide (TPR) repeat protein
MPGDASAQAKRQDYTLSFRKSLKKPRSNRRTEKLGAKGSGLHSALGLALAQGDKLDEAMAHLNIALQQDKKGTNADAHLGKAVVLYKQSQKLEALREIDKTIKAHGGRYPQARNFKREILISLSRIEEAKTSI